MSGCFQINSKLVTTTKQLTKQSRQLANKLRRPFLSPTINSVNILTLVFKYKGTISDNPPVKIGANIHSIFIKKKKNEKKQIPLVYLKTLRFKNSLKPFKCDSFKWLCT